MRIGVVISAIAPKEQDEQALRALLGDQYEKIEAEPTGEVTRP